MIKHGYETLRCLPFWLIKNVYNVDAVLFPASRLAVLNEHEEACRRSSLSSRLPRGSQCCHHVPAWLLDYLMWWYAMSILDAKWAGNRGLQEAASLAAKAVLSTFIQPILSCPCSPKLADLYMHRVEFLFIFCKWITMNHYSKPMGTCRRGSLQSWVLCLDVPPQDPFHVLTEQAGNLTLQAIFVCIWWIALTVIPIVRFMRQPFIALQLTCISTKATSRRQMQMRSLEEIMCSM